MEQQMLQVEKREQVGELEKFKQLVGEPQMCGICYEWNDGEYRWNDMFI